ncbi:hypothetical protein [Isoptericola cucumis]|uniref:HTH marR-type domain-containing protein n=1 Tax=Isoptericola cucumis TaxID=1776856 RepID=A0ABQ2BCG6_9MICO|nr:hypothetical protein [Isoptericola cucumis]GGI10861.1 hypothetical protein GCM10007368_33340 [Isoptericola cucumis]
MLETRGLAERRTGTDRRRHSIHVTAGGRDTVEEVRSAIWAAEDDLLSGLLAHGRDSLQDILERALEVRR